MSYDWRLIHELNAKALRDAEEYRCPFVDAIRAGDGKAARVARQILKDPFELKKAIGDPIRGQVTGWRPMDRRPPYHQRRETSRANVAAGEIVFKGPSYVAGEYKP